MTVRCLIVDDNDHFLQAAQRVLNDQGIDVVGVASTSAEALRRVQELRPDVALVDVCLGAECGFDLVHAFMRALAEPPRMIMISAYPETDFADMVAASPCVGFLTKTGLSGSAIRTLLENTDAVD